MQEDKERLKEKVISYLGEEINKRVYKFYGLDENNRKVIGEFSERF